MLDFDTRSFSEKKNTFKYIEKLIKFFLNFLTTDIIRICKFMIMMFQGTSPK